MSSALIATVNDIKKKYLFYSDIFIITIGLISNLSLILIFVTLRPFRGKQCAFFLTVESISNIGLLLSNYPSFIYRDITGKDPENITVVWCKLQSSLSQIFGLCSLFTICFLSFDQFMSTNPRPHWRQMSTLKLARRLTFFNVCFVMLHSILFLIFTEIIKGQGCTLYNPILYSYFTFFYYPILSSAIPLLVTVTFSLLAYRNVRRIVRRQIAVVRRRLDHQLTAMVLARVCSIVLLGLPFIIFSLYQVNFSATQNNQLEVAIVSLASSIVSSLIYLNFSVR
jgi:hypothetical protein